MRFFLTYNSRVGDAFKAVSDSASREHLRNFPVRIRNDSEPIALRQSLERLARVRTYLAPVRRHACERNQLGMQDFIGEAQLVQQMRVVNVPESMVHRCVLLKRIEFALRLAFNFHQKIEGRKYLSFVQWPQYDCMIQEQQRISNVKKDGLKGHVFSVSWGAQSPSRALFEWKHSS